MAQTTQLQAELDEANVIVRQVNGYNNFQDEISNLGIQVENAQEQLSLLYPQIATTQTDLQALQDACVLCWVFHVLRP